MQQPFDSRPPQPRNALIVRSSCSGESRAYRVAGESLAGRAQWIQRTKGSLKETQCGRC